MSQFSTGSSVFKSSHRVNWLVLFVTEEHLEPGEQIREFSTEREREQIRECSSEKEKTDQGIFYRESENRSGNFLQRENRSGNFLERERALKREL